MADDSTTAIPQILVRVAGVPGVARRAIMRMKVRAMRDAMRMWRRRLMRGRSAKSVSLERFIILVHCLFSVKVGQ